MEGFAIIYIIHCVISHELQTPEAFEKEYSKRAIEGGFDVVDAGIRLYDVMWVLALALNNTVAMVRSGDISETECSNVSGSLVPLEEFNYTNEKMGCLIQWNLQQTNFSGGSVSSLTKLVPCTAALTLLTDMSSCCRVILSLT